MRRRYSRGDQRSLVILAGFGKGFSDGVEYGAERPTYRNAVVRELDYILGKFAASLVRPLAYRAARADLQEYLADEGL